jgi:hypothetical protein
LPSRAIPAELRFQVRELDAGCCAYCHTPEALTVTTFEVDHIVPRSAGGETALGNLCLSCPSCNRHKGARQSAALAQTRQLTPLYHPRKQQWHSHFAWSEDKTRLVGQTPTGHVTIEALHINRAQAVRLRGLWVKLGLFSPD